MFEDPLLLARFQFALTAAVHYMFVALTLGLAPYILFGQFRATLQRDETKMRAVRFWGGLYILNYAMGILSGIVMELQLSLNWSGLHEMYGYAFGAPLAIEAMGAFFIESTFLGLWIFGWDRMGKWAHWCCFLVVTATAYASAYWVLVSNGFLKYPTGISIEDGEAVIDDVGAMAANPSALMAFAHVALSALLLGGAVIAAASAYHLRRDSDPDGMYQRGVRHGTALLLIALLPTVISGGLQFIMFGQDPPSSGTTYSAEQIAAIEEAYGDLSTAHALGITGDMVMMLSWALMLLVGVVSAGVWTFRGLGRWRWHLRLLALVPVLPYVASVGGWVFRETERQPWTVRHHLTTADAVTDMSPLMATVSFSLFTLAFAVLGTVTAWLLVRFARLGPNAGPLAPPRVCEQDGEDGHTPVLRL